ncbi:hypothetical protein [Pseudomonas aeruginosa]|uniref:hypothetical protein n=1 Tax=Pseudomonas aeruginosa TaxID=287 RepID=UPI000A791CAB|nr:hypothetical protein [Pseudomonas aeruginosa]
MTESKICTCPSGNGSLRHPCPAHPAPVEQAGGDERAAFESRAEDAGSDISLDDFGNYVNVYVQTEWEGWQARAALSKRSKFRQHLDECADEVATWPSYKREALAQPSPAQADEKPGDSILCYGCFAKGVGPDHFDEAGKCLAAQAEQAEAERPDVVWSAWGNIYNNGFDHVAPFPPAPGGPVVDEPLMTVAQHAASVARWAEMFNRVEQERDSALARVAELTATRNRYGVDAHYFNKNLQRILRDFESFTPDELARSLIILAKVADEKVVAQHSVPDELRAICMLVAETGIKYGCGRHRAVAADECRAVVNAVLNADLSVGRACEYAGCCEKAHPGTSLCIAHHSKKAREQLLAAAPGKEVGHE